METGGLITDFFNSTATIERENQSTTSMGGVKKTYSTRITSLKCRITPMSIHRRSAYSEADEFGKMTIRQGLILYCKTSTANKAIDESDRVVLGSRTFQVKGINNPGLLDRHLEIDLLEIV